MANQGRVVQSAPRTDDRSGSGGHDPFDPLVLKIRLEEARSRREKALADRRASGAPLPQRAAVAAVLPLRGPRSAPASLDPAAPSAQVPPLPIPSARPIPHRATPSRRLPPVLLATGAVAVALAGLALAVQVAPPDWRLSLAAWIAPDAAPSAPPAATTIPEAVQADGAGQGPATPIVVGTALPPARPAQQTPERGPVVSLVIDGPAPAALPRALEPPVVAAHFTPAGSIPSVAVGLAPGPVPGIALPSRPEPLEPPAAARAALPAQPAPLIARGTERTGEPPLPLLQPAAPERPVDRAVLGRPPANMMRDEPVALARTPFVRMPVDPPPVAFTLEAAAAQPGRSSAGMTFADPPPASAIAVWLPKRQPAVIAAPAVPSASRTAARPPQPARQQAAPPATARPAPSEPASNTGRAAAAERAALEREIARRLQRQLKILNNR